MSFDLRSLEVSLQGLGIREKFRLSSYFRGENILDKGMVLRADSVTQSLAGGKGRREGVHNILDSGYEGSGADPTYPRKDMWDISHILGILGDVSPRILKYIRKGLPPLIFLLLYI